MKTINIGILGCGVVGSGVVNVLTQNKNEISKKVGVTLNILKVADKDSEKLKNIKLLSNLKTTDAFSVVNNSQIDVVVEAIGGVGIAKELVFTALNNKKCVVTSNKELVSKFSQELFSLAHKNNVEILFEASCGGGIPIITSLRHSLAGNKIEKIVGIVNGTTNYILTKMQNENSEFADALAEAQHKGYAEADPTNDIEGFDSVYKISILSAVGWGYKISPDKIMCEGITKIADQDIKYARELGYCIKLLALAKIINGELEIKVHPSLVPINHQLALISGVYNAIYVVGNAVGELMFVGRGAGSLPTASAVVGDIVEFAKKIKEDRKNNSANILTIPKIIDKDKITSKFYIRMKVADKPGVIAKVATILGKNNVSIESVIQKASSESIAEIVWLTHNTQNGNMQKSLQSINKLSAVQEIGNVIAVDL